MNGAGTGTILVFETVSPTIQAQFTAPQGCAAAEDGIAAHPYAALQDVSTADLNFVPITQVSDL